MKRVKDYYYDPWGYGGTTARPQQQQQQSVYGGTGVGGYDKWGFGGTYVNGYVPWLPDSYSQIFRIVCVWPFGLLNYGSATLRCKI